MTHRHLAGRTDDSTSPALKPGVTLTTFRYMVRGSDLRERQHDVSRDRAAAAAHRQAEARHPNSAAHSGEGGAASNLTLAPRTRASAAYSFSEAISITKRYRTSPFNKRS
jgi:hypothetical protein